MFITRKTIFLAAMLLGCGLSSLQLVEHCIAGKHELSENAYAHATLSDWTASVFATYKEYSQPGSYTREKEHEAFLNKLKPDITKALEAFIGQAQSQLCNRDLWLNKEAAFDKKSALFDYKKDPGSSYQHPFVERQVIPADSQVCFIGDIHGSIHSLLRILCYLAGSGKLGDDFALKQDNFYMVFNGDFTDRGRYGTEVWYTVLRLKLANPTRVFLVRGNHEDCDINNQTHVGAFDKEVEAKLGKNHFHYFRRLYELLPMATYLDSNGNRLQCCHGGIETGYDPRPLLQSKKQFDAISDNVNETIKMIEKDFFGTMFGKENNYSGFNWSDFYQQLPEQIASYIKKMLPSKYSNKDSKTIQKKLFKELKEQKHLFPYKYLFKHFSFNALRGCGYVADAYATCVYLKYYGLKGIIRGHQDMQCGCKMLFDPKKQEACFDAARKYEDKKVKPDILKKISHGNKLYHDGPYHWIDVVKKDDIANEKGFLLSDYLPVITFTTATEARGLPHDCFGILVITDDYKTWRLKPYELALASDRNGMFACINQYSKKENYYFFDHRKIAMGYKELVDMIKKVYS